ncbi:hypothetical protein PG991_014342 [Apiospora marii]|uniref:Uncharacterized protein n=1 Tax=Apiospora marii TaxID=335849 RepID=A0ABR1R8J3_9PEZI
MISLDMNRYERKLDRIRRHNISIYFIRTQVENFQNIQPSETRHQISGEGSLPSWIPEIHDMSKEAHAALTLAFSCQFDEHFDHFAALKSDISHQYGGGVRLDMGISSCLNRSYEQRNLLQFSLEPCPPYDVLQPLPPSRNNRLQIPGEPMRNRKSEWPTTQEPQVASLSEIKNACAYLETCLGKETQANTNYTPLAYLHKATSCQHSFHVMTGRKKKSRYSGTLKNMLLGTEKGSVTDQLQLAIKVTIAVLQFHSTPWLRESWDTSDILLGTPDYAHCASHAELFLRSCFFNQTTDDDDDNDADLPMAPGMKHSLRDYGIDNLTLFSLGMIRRCLNCHFGYGHDLSSVELQSAVYSNVVCPLQELVEKLDGT